MKYEIGDKVIHCRNGVSTIVGMKEMMERQYFVIHALRGDKENIYVPVVGSENIIRPVMDVAFADNLLHELASVKKEFNPNTKQRRDGFKRRLSSGNINDIAYLYRQKCLFDQYPEDVKLGPADLDMLEFASNILLDELALTYNADREKIEEIIAKKIK
ncbi:MAG: hypothetical protein K6C32_04365 [Bacilli bacterium]|nr:hypothetical protein [Bacilli bacterium]